MTGALDTVIELDAYNSPEDRVIDAALRCFARHGLAKTTVDDVAREAGISRATLYRVVDGGRDGLLEAVVTREIAHFLDLLRVRLEGIDDVEELLTVGFAESLRFLTAHVGFGTMMTAEPSTLMRGRFDDADPPFVLIRAFVATYLGDTLGDERSIDHFCEVLVRLLMSFATVPSPWLHPDDPEAIRAFVAAHLVPALGR